MVWVLTSNEQRLRCEVAHGAAPGSYSIVVSRAGQPPTTETVDQPAALVERIVALMTEWRSSGWQLA